VSAPLPETAAMTMAPHGDRIASLAGFGSGGRWRARSHAAQSRDIGGKFPRQEKRFLLVVSGQEPDQNVRHDAPDKKALKMIELK